MLYVCASRSVFKDHVKIIYKLFLIVPRHMSSLTQINCFHEVIHKIMPLETFSREQKGGHCEADDATFFRFSRLGNRCDALRTAVVDLWDSLVIF